MKIRFSSVIVLLIIAAAFSCNKYDFNYPKDKVGISTVVSFPTISTVGDKTIYLKVGDSYTDQGAIAILGGDTATYTTDGTVDPATPGIYNITYTAANPQGYTASDWRAVAVIGDDVAANDFSGIYTRTDNTAGVTSTWTKTGPGLYSVENGGGAATGAGFTVTAVNYTGNKVAIPQQVSADYGGAVSSSLSSITAGAYQWVFNAPNYGASVRHFSK